MGLLRAIGGLFSSAGHAIAGVAHSAWQGIKSVFHFAAGVFNLVGGAWSWMLNGISWLGDTLIGALARLLHLLEWIALHAIPEGLSWAFKKAIAWARVAVKDVERALSTLIRSVLHFLLGVIRSVEHWVKGALRSVWHTLSAAWNWIENAGRKLYDLVMHPERLAAWLGGHVLVPLLKWLLGNGAALIVWLFRVAAREAPEVAHVVEDALAKLI